MKAVLFALAILAQDAQDGTPFESREYGLQLRIPSGWTIDATRQSRVILKIHQSGPSEVPPEIQVLENRQGEPVTPTQYKERLRLVLQQQIKEARIVDERSSRIGSAEGCLFVIECKGNNDQDMISMRGVWCLSPTRFLGIDAAALKADAALLQASMDQLVASVKITARPAPVVDGPAKKWPGSKAAIPVSFKDELEVLSGDRVVGSYAVELRQATRDGVEGYEYVNVFQADFGDEGKQETRVRGFLAADLSLQAVETSLFQVGRDKRAIFLTASAELKGGKAAVQRRLNGELQKENFEVPAGTVLLDLFPAAHHHLLELGKGLSAIPALPLFDNEPGTINVETLGVQKVKMDDKTVEIYVIGVAQSDRVLTYWYDAGRVLVRITGMGPSIVVKKKKK